MPQSKEKRLDSFLRKTRHLCGHPSPLRGDASTRSFYRVPFRSGTAVAMVCEETRPEDERIFIEVRDLLAAAGVPVPVIYDYDPETGVILMQDFGDVTLEQRLRDAGPDDCRHFYRRAIDELLKIQVRGTRAGGTGVAFRRAFDEKKLTEELDFFLAHTVEGFFRARLEAPERELIRDAFATLAAGLAALPRALNHRDYHSRNLMVVGSALGIVDFQDARMGPCQYDLASLLRDSYTVVERGLRREMLDYYIGGSAAMGIQWHDREEFIRRFDLMSLQRNLKACGTFGYMAVARGDERYTRYLEPTGAYVRDVAPRFPFMKECMEILGRHVPFLR